MAKNHHNMMKTLMVFFLNIININSVKKIKGKYDNQICKNN